MHRSRTGTAPVGRQDGRRVRDLQERAARAVPAAVEEHRAGCWLRHTDSASTWWAGATLVHDQDAGEDLERRIDVAEAFYADHGAPARFQVCPACPPGLDAALARRGYSRGGFASLQVASAAAVAGHRPDAAFRVDVADSADARWLDLLVAGQAVGSDPGPERRLLRRVGLPSAYATAMLSDRPVAVGRAVADSGWTGVFGMATLPEARGRGAGAAVLASLARWAAERGCARLYLQVTRESRAALRLYRRAGFEEVCTYHYRAP